MSLECLLSINDYQRKNNEGCTLLLDGEEYPVMAISLSASGIGSQTKDEWHQYGTRRNSNGKPRPDKMMLDMASLNHS